MLCDSKKVLVLNKSWSPLRTVTLRTAIGMLHSEDNEPKAKIIDPESYQTMTWSDWSKLKVKATDEVIRSANAVFRIPEVILLTTYDKVPMPKVHFSRRTMFKRDEHKCQYCSSREDLTIDHIIPRAQGGKTTWENCVAACYKCNAKKADKTPKQAGMKLLKQPERPNWRLFKCDLKHRVKSWEMFIGDAYWNIELINDMDDEYYSK